MNKCKQNISTSSNKISGVRQPLEIKRLCCNLCFMLQLATEYGEAVKFLKVDTDEEHELASEMKVCETNLLSIDANV